MLDFGSGTATFTCSTQLSPYQRVNIVGTTGRIEIEIPVNAPAKRPCRLWYAHDSTIDEVVFDVCNQYTLQGDAFSRAIMDNAPAPTPLEDALDNMRVIDAVIRSGREGQVAPYARGPWTAPQPGKGGRQRSWIRRSPAVERWRPRRRIQTISRRIGGSIGIPRTSWRPARLMAGASATPLPAATSVSSAC